MKPSLFNYLKSLLNSLAPVSTLPLAVTVPKARQARFLAFLALLIASLLTSGCATQPPRDIDNLCNIFREHRDWYKAAERTYDEWGSPPYVTLAIIHQESKFRAKAKPPRRKFLGFIPGPRPSSAYGYAQAVDTTWEQYLDSAGGWSADRDEFSHAIDFIGWYNAESRRRNGIALTDTRRLYLAYHEGHGGYARGTYKRKQWLLNVASKVERRSRTYQRQYSSCRDELDRPFLLRLLS